MAAEEVEVEFPEPPAQADWQAWAAVAEQMVRMYMEVGVRHLSSQLHMDLPRLAAPAMARTGNPRRTGKRAPYLLSAKFRNSRIGSGNFLHLR